MGYSPLSLRDVFHGTLRRARIDMPEIGCQLSLRAHRGMLLTECQISFILRSATSLWCSCVFILVAAKARS